MDMAGVSAAALKGADAFVSTPLQPNLWNSEYANGTGNYVRNTPGAPARPRCIE